MKMGKPRIEARRSRLDRRGKGERERDRWRKRKIPWRKLYSTKRWQELRRKVLKRDGYQCQQTGVMLVGPRHAPNSPIVDHKVPASVFWFDGRQHLFWDEENLQSVSKAWHDAEKQRQERAE